MFDVDQYIEPFKLTYKNTPENLEGALHTIKELGATSMESLLVLMSTLKLSISEADQVILNSETWSEIKDHTIYLREDFQEAWSQNISELPQKMRD